MHEQIAKIMELVRMHGAAWHASGASHHTPGEAARCEVMAESHREEIEEALRALVSTKPLSDAQIDTVFEQMPDGPQGFLKSWGYRQFAHELLEAAASQARAPLQSEPANHRLTLMVDAAMVEMQGIYPPLRRSDCQRLINAALAAAPAIFGYPPVIDPEALMELVKTFAAAVAKNLIKQMNGEIEIAHEAIAAKAAILAMVTGATPAQTDPLEPVKQAIREFHYGLDTRKNGNLVANQALAAIQTALNMPWVQGAEADRRAREGSS